jgi:hypothetical protein
MPPCSEPVTSSPFERRLPGGRLDSVFKVAFGSNAAAARALRVSKMTIWRWRHDQSQPPESVAGVLADRIEGKVREVQAAEDELRCFRALAPRPPRKLSGCCAGLSRRAKRLPRTAEDWAALGD